MDRNLWLQPLSPFEAPAWPCPRCRQSALRLIPKVAQSFETADSKRRSKSGDSRPEEVEKLFTAWLRCCDSQCSQEVAVTGTGHPTDINEPEGDSYWEDAFWPRFAHPMPDMFTIPGLCPKDVAQELRAAFQLFWTDKAASANRLRRAIERLLDRERVKKRAKNRKGELVDLSLHARIAEFGKKNQDVAAPLMALKCLGNAGSHHAEVSEYELLDALEVMEYCVHEMVMRRSAHVRGISKQLSSTHGKAKRRRRPSA